MDPVEEIKERLPIEDLVGRYLDLKRSGAGLKGLCPFHQEKTPSFYVSPSRGTFHCFGCSRGGDVFSFAMEIERLSFPDALKRLADMSGVQLPERDSKVPSLKNRLWEANALAADYFHQALRDQRGERALRYLTERGFDAESVRLFQLGFAPVSRDSLVEHLRSKGFDDRILLAAGLALQDDIGGRARDRFRGRLMFPIRDQAGKISGFGGRTLGDDQPKYLNSPQTEVFDKSAVLFGIHLAADAIRQSRRAVVVEGYLDAVRAHSAGYQYVVASLGTAVTARQLHLLSRVADVAVLALDPDSAGQAAAARTALSALAEVTRTRGRPEGASAALDLRIAVLPDGHGDPDELIAGRPELWEAAIDASVPAFEFFFAHTMTSLGREQDNWKQEAIDRLLPVIQQFSDSAAWQATWVERLAAETGIDPVLLQRSLPRGGMTSGRRSGRARPPSLKRDATLPALGQGLTRDPAAQVEDGLIALLLQLLILPAGADDALQAADFGRPEYRAIVAALLRWRRTGNYDYEMFRETLPEPARETADALRGLATPPPDPDKFSVAVEIHLKRLRHVRLKTRIAQATQFLADLDEADLGAAAHEVARLMAERGEVERSLEQLTQLAVQAAGRQGTIDHESGRL